MHGIGLLQGVKVQSIVSGNEVDTSGFEGVMFVTKFSAAHASNVVTAHHGDLANGSDQAATVGTVDMDATATVGVLQVHKPRKRYVSPVATAGGAGSVTSITAILYGARNSAVPQSTDINAVNSVSPATA